MSTKIEIVNLALTMIGHRRVSSLSVSNKTTREVNAVYPTTLEECLEKVNWSFARLQAKLPLIKATVGDVQPIDGWSFLYGQPPKCLKARFVYPQGGRYKATPADFAECLNPANQVKALATDIEDAYCEYTIKVEDTTQYTPAFVKALAAGLAAELALPLTENEQRAGAMMQIYRGRLSEAARVNVRRSHDKKPVPSSFVDSRA